MDKPIVNMINWTIVKGDEDYFLHGTCDYHPYLGKNAFVSRTSPLEKYTFEDDILNYETRHTVYTLEIVQSNAMEIKGLTEKYRDFDIIYGDLEDYVNTRKDKKRKIGTDTGEKLSQKDIDRLLDMYTQF